jgi:hypothetical protein
MIRSNSSRWGWAVWCALSALVMVGCSKSSTGPDATNPNVNLVVAFSKAGTPGLLKGSGIAATDSLRIDSAVVVFERIKFESRIDTVIVDTTGKDSPDTDRDLQVMLKGPFVVHVRDTVAIDFANKTLPAGTYDGIQFKIHRLMAGESHEDSDERHNKPKPSDSAITGSSISVWGSVKKSGTWTRFAFYFDGEIEFKLKGNFVVDANTSTFTMALNFNIGSWFTNVQTGALLDPTDLSGSNRDQLKRAIYAAFGKGRGGRDRNGDGHPD